MGSFIILNCLFSLIDLVNFSIKSMEMVKNKWDHFGNNFEALSNWIAEQEKELETLETSSSPLDIQISQIKVISSCTFSIKSPFRCYFARGQMRKETFYMFQKYHDEMMAHFIH